MVFHSGRYQCLDKSVALMEFNKIIVELLRTFDFSIVDAERPARITNAMNSITFLMYPIVDNVYQGVWLIKDFWVRITLR